MAYTAEKPKLVPDREELRRRIPGWGVDLDPQNRPASKKENFNPAGTGAHWEFPERQIPTFAREKSTEHKMLTPVFGTACPLKGLSGIVRRYAYRYSEGRAIHWLLLLLGDRVDVLESGIVDLFRGRADNFLKEYGIRSEFTHHGLRSRTGQHRVDVKRIPLEFIALAGMGAAALAAFGVLGKRGASRSAATSGSPESSAA